MEKILKIKSEDVKIGMRFSAPLFFDDMVNMFLPEGKPVRQRHLAALVNWKIPYVATYGKLIDENDTGAYDSAEVVEMLEELDEAETPDAPVSSVQHANTGHNGTRQISA